MKLRVVWIAAKSRSKNPAFDSLTHDYATRIAKYQAIETSDLPSESALLKLLHRTSGRTAPALVLLESTGKELTSERLAAFMNEAVDKALANACALIPSICLVRSPSALRYMDEHVPGITVPAATIERCERASDPEQACFDVACELAEHARSLPGVSGLHLISFRREAGIARLCQRLGIPTRSEREMSGYRRPVAV